MSNEVGWGRLEQFLHPSLGLVNYEVAEVPDDSDGQVQRVVELMTRYAEEDSGTPAIQAQAQQAVQANPSDPLQGVFDLVRGQMRFIKDEITTDAFGHLSTWKPFVEALIRPVDVASEERFRFGDCDDFSMYTACLLTNLGIPCSFVTIAADQSDPSRFSHVYVAAYPNGERVAMDTSHGQYPGWEAPGAFRVVEWPVGRDRQLGQWAVIGAAVLAWWWAWNKGWVN